MASGVSAMNALPIVTRTTAPMKNRPTPSRRTARPATAAPTSELSPPIAGDQPDHARREARCRSRTRGRPRRTRPRTRRSRRRPGRAGAGSGRASVRREALADLVGARARGRRPAGPRAPRAGSTARNSAETRNETASSAIAMGAVSSWMSQPPIAEPDELGRRAAAGQRRVGLDQPVAADHGRQVGPIGGVEERRQHRGPERHEDQVQQRQPAEREGDRDARRAAAPARDRPRSGSAAAEAGRPRRRRTARRPAPPTSSAPRRIATSPAPAPSTRIAANGSAVRVTNEPSIETVVAAHSRAKSRSRQTLGIVGIGGGYVSARAGLRPAHRSPRRSSADGRLD